MQDPKLPFNSSHIFLRWLRRVRILPAELFALRLGFDASKTPSRRLVHADKQPVSTSFGHSVQVF